MCYFLIFQWLCRSRKPSKKSPYFNPVLGKSWKSIMWTCNILGSIWPKLWIFQCYYIPLIQWSNIYLLVEGTRYVLPLPSYDFEPFRPKIGSSEYNKSLFSWHIIWREIYMFVEFIFIRLMRLFHFLRV